LPPTSASAPRTGLEAIDFVMVGVYLLVTFGIVVWSSRKQDTTEDFFLAGRRMPWLAVGMSLLATLMSTITYLGLPGEIVKNGVAMLFGYLAIPLSMCVVLLLWIPFFMRLRMTSAYEYLEQRFCYRARLLGGLLFFLLRLGWISVVVYAASLALEQMTGWSLYRIIVVVGVAATVYTCIGGIRAVIWNDVLQFVMLFGGTLLTLGYVMWTTGTGPVDWWASVSADPNTVRHTTPPLFSFDLTVRMTIITAMMQSFFWVICTHASDQVVLQRYFTTSSLSAARRSYLVNAVSDITVGSMLALSGLALLSFYLQHPGYLPPGMSPGTSADKVLPYFFAHQLPAGLGGLILAGFLCDAMQTLDSGVNSITAVGTKDLFARLFPGSAPRGELAFARLLTIFVGLAVTVMAYGVAYNAEHSGLNIVDQMPRRFNMFLGPLASLFFIGMFLPRCTSRTAIPAVLCGLAVSIVWSWWKELFGTSYSPTITLAIGVPAGTSFLLAAVLGLLFEGRRDHPGREYTWRAIMRRL
jgi:SSS family solute:Na+ symporter